jgi:multidrug efflux system membrane fusion protein
MLSLSLMPSSARALAAVAVASACLLAGCGEGPKQAAAPPPKVTVAKPTQRTIVDQDEYVGRFVPVDVVEIRARVSGYLDRIHFIDGQILKQGDLLFTIDKRPFQNTLDQSRANLETAKSNLAFTQSDLTRAQQLVRERTISEQIYEQRMQAFRNSQGNLVTGGAGGNTTMLATIVSIDPIRFEFTLDEASLLRYQRLAAGKNEVAGLGGTSVRLKLLDETEFSHSARMDFVDNVVDRASGTIRGRAQLENPDNLFTPGMFARVQVPASAPYQALMVPDAAIGSEQARKFVYLIDQDNVARLRYVTLGQLVDDLRVIKEGLSAGDRVVVNGLMRVRQGVKVTPEERPASPQASVPARATADKTD